MKRPPEETVYRHNIKETIRDIEAILDVKSRVEKKGFLIFKGEKTVIICFCNDSLRVTAQVKDMKLLTFTYSSDVWSRGNTIGMNRKMDPLVFLKDALAVL